MTDDFSYEIVKNIGTLSEGKGGWTLELNMVSWGGRSPKYDIRSWAPDHQKMGKGVTLTKEDMIALKDLLEKTQID
ncbi:MAG: YdbC family protein [Treponema sp.]|nr:YdbC family protein [Treponema sp.]